MPDYYPGRFDVPYLLAGNPFAEETEEVSREAVGQQHSRMHYGPDKTVHGNTGFLGDELPGGLYFRAGTTEEEIRELIRQKPWAFISPNIQRSRRPESLPSEY